MYYAHKQFLVTARMVEEDEWLSTDNGEFLVKKGNIILTDYNGNSFPTTPEFFKIDYVPVKLVNKKINVEEMAKGYQEMSEINLEEANAAKDTYNDGMELYK